MLRDRIVLLDEFVNGHEAATNTENQVVILDFHDDLASKVVVVAVTVSHKETLHAFLRVSPIYEISQLSVHRVFFVADVLEVHLMQLSPVLDHLFKLSVTVPEGLHLSQVGGELRSVLSEFLFHLLKILGVALVLLL